MMLLPLFAFFFFFWEPQNRRNNPDRMEMMKYNKYLKKHTLHREIKK